MIKKNLVFAALTMLVPALAQNPAPPPAAGGPMGNTDAGTELKSLTTSLHLNATQQAEAGQILAQRQAQVLAVRAEFPAPRPGSAPPPGGPVKMATVMKTAHATMLQILDAGQQAKYNQIDTTGNGPPPAGR